MLSKTPKQNIATPLSRKAVLLSVTVSQWSGRRLDRTVTDETNERYHAQKDAGRYNKLVIKKECFDEIIKSVSAIRSFFYKHTQPWADEGPRVCSNMLFEKVTNELRRLIREFDAAADKFELGYAAAIEESKTRLNGMWRASDYPSPKEIRNRFRCSTRVLPFPSAADFRSDLDDDTVDDIRRDIEAATNEAYSSIKKDTVERIMETVGHMAERLKAYGVEPEEGKKRSYFTDSLVGNVRELADLLPAFNFDNDPKLNDITARIQKELCMEEAGALRENDDARVTVQKSAEKIVADIGKFFA